MRILKIEPSDFSPKVYFNLDENKFEISGESRPENTSKFYAPLIEWAEALATDEISTIQAKTLHFDFKFEYFNSTSAKFILDFLQTLQACQEKLKNSKIIIRWYYDERDEDMHDSGEEFSHLVNLPFEFIQV